MSFFGTRRQAEPALPPTAEREPSPALPPAPRQPVGFETVLGANCTLEGTLRSTANVRLDGTFTGTLEIAGNILVGETAKINADINARNISIAGAVRGNINGKKVQLLRTGRIWGDIHAVALTTEEGAFIDGKITMISHEAAAPAPTPLLDDDSSAEAPPENPPPTQNSALDEVPADEEIDVAADEVTPTANGDASEPVE